jgi:hypothetical protein
MTQYVVLADDDGVPYVVSGGGGGGDASSANQTAVQAVAGSNAAKATAVQGIDGGKAVPISGTVTANLSATDNAVLDQIELNTDTAGLRLSFNNIANAPANTVGTWNTYFGTAIFETLEVVGNDAILKGVGTFILPTNCFKNSTALTKIVDMSGYIVAAYDNAFQGTTVLNYLYLPALISSGFSFCSGSSVVSAFTPKAKQFGDDSFNGCATLTLIDFSDLEDVDDSFLATSSAIQTVLLPSLKIAGDNLLKNTAAYIVSVPELVVTKNSAFDRTSSGNIEIELKAPKWKYTGTNALAELKTFSELVIPSLEIAGAGSFGVTTGATIKATVNTKFAGSNAPYIALKAANTVTQTTVDDDRAANAVETAKDAGGRFKVSSLTTLFDGKTLNADNANLWHTAGTGTGTFDSTGVDANGFDMSVTSGQWYVRQSNRFMPYFSGKPQSIELTLENFHNEANVVKRAGYFSSTAVSPHATVLDGIWLENTGTGVALVIANQGTETLRISQTDFNVDTLTSQDWSKFNVILIEFLWLGGLVARLSVGKTNGDLKLVHSYSHVGQTGMMFKSPNQPVRYEIRSSTGVGSLSAICSQVATDGGTNEAGESTSFFTKSGTTVNVTTPTVGTIYALLGLKKQVANRDVAVKLVTFGVVNSASADAGILMLIKDPTLSTTLTYTNVGKVQQGIPTDFANPATITAGTGTIIASVPVSQNGEHQEMNEDYLLWLQNNIADTLSEYVVAYMPTTATQTNCATMTYKVYN